MGSVCACVRVPAAADPRLRVRICMLTVEPRDRKAVVRTNCIAGSLNEASTLVEGHISVR